LCAAYWLVISTKCVARLEDLMGSSGKGGKEYKERLVAAVTINTRRAAAAAMHAGRPCR